MATSKSVNKMDLSLDDIIKLNKRKGSGGGRGKGRGRGKTQNNPEGVVRPGGLAQQQKKGLKGRGRGQGRSGGNQQSGGGNRGNQQSGSGNRGNQQSGGRAVGNQQSGGRAGGNQQSGGRAGGNQQQKGTKQQKAQRLRDRARQTLRAKKQKAASVQQNTPQITEVESTGVKQRLGVRGVVSARGRGARPVGIGRGGVRSVGTPGAGNRPGSQLRALRRLKLQRADTRGRGRGAGQARDALKQAVSRGRGRGRQQPPQQSITPALPILRGGRGRRGGGRGGAGRERGEQPNIQVFTTSPQFEPVGVEIPLVLCAEQHTSKSLHNRFTPKVEQKASSQRMVQRRGRTVNFNS